jgi:archaeal flagellin FlaB
MKSELGFSGLEAAIVLIAFVVVAAVFAYVMMSTGFFATQRLQEVTYAGVKQSSSTVITDGFIRGTYNSVTGIQSLSFSLNVPEAGEAIDLSKMIYYYVRNNGGGSEVPLTSVNPGSGILHPGERTRINLNLASASMAGPMAGESFSLEIKPPLGASTLIRRVLPEAYSGGFIS